MREQIMNDDRHDIEGADADAPDPARIRALNDALRQTFTGGRIVMTTLPSAGVGALPDRMRGALITAVRAFDRFDGDNDPYGEHDFGALTVEGEQVYFKIDYFDRSLRLSSPDPADPTVTVRVLTLMLVNEY